MEGPTPSSAIFYGSLSVHIGVFLLLRTYPFWEHQFSIRLLIGAVGLLTAIMATLAARVQSSVKAQIGYSSIAQIGLIFMEVAAGWQWLALVHFAGNAFLRSYQLLVSPSVVTYLIREQFFNFTPRQNTFEDRWPKRLEYTFYMLSLREWGLDSAMYRWLWNPLKRAGAQLGLLTERPVLVSSLLAYLLGLYAVYHKHMVPPVLEKSLPIVFATVALTMVLKSFSERKNAYLSLLLVALSHFWVALAVAFNAEFSFTEIHIYLSGVTVCVVVGYFSLKRLEKLEGRISLNQFHGHVREHPRIAMTFFMASLGLAGFPITPTFMGEDLIFSHIGYDQVFLAAFIALGFIVDGLALVRIYARVFLGPTLKHYHEKAIRSS